MKKEKSCTDIRRFAEMVCRAVSEELGGEVQVKLQEVIKNNGVVLQGLVILNGKSNLSPTIYLNPFLEAYENDMPLTGIVEGILNVYRKEMPDDTMDMDFFREFERVKEGICYRIINRERNKTLLERIPHINFLDLSICFYYAFRDERLGNGSILVYNNHMDFWGCDVETLLRYARENTPRLYPSEFINMADVLEEQMQEKLCGRLPMYVLGNEKHFFGAASILYPDALSAAGERFGENFFILPSSIHEVILLPVQDAADTETMRDMVREINLTQLAPEEVLSDNVYFYDCASNHVKIMKV